MLSAVPRHLIIRLSLILYMRIATGTILCSFFITVTHQLFLLLDVSSRYSAVIPPYCSSITELARNDRDQYVKEHDNEEDLDSIQLVPL